MDLADRVKDLIADPVLGQSKQSVTLAAMLLSDWVFAQSPKAVRQITDVLGTPDGLRRLAATGQRHVPSEIVRIPVRSGGSDILASAFNTLELPGLQWDQRWRFALVANAHGTQEEISRRWLASPLASTDAVAWAQVGSTLGALSRIEKDALLRKLEGVSLAKIIPILADARRFDCILTSEANASLLWYQFLSGRLHFLRQNIGEAPFFMMPLLIGPERYHPFMSYRRGDIDRAVQTFRSSTEQAELSDQFRSQFVRECYEISTTICDTLGDIRKNAELLEDCRRRWGAKPAILNAALNMSAQPYLPRVKASHFSLLDFNEGMVS